MKFDGVQTDRFNPASSKLKKLAGIQTGSSVFLAGSTQFEEDIAVATAFKKIAADHPALRLIIVPRHPERCGQLVRSLAIWV